MDEHRNNRLRLNRTSLTADLLKERCSTEHTSFSELAQADIFIALFGVAQLKGQDSNNGFYNFWRPRTSVYSSESRKPPIFLKAVDPDIRNHILFAIGVKSAADLMERVSDARLKTEGFRHLSLGRMFGFDFEKAVNLETLIR
jgi:hypothetical protein